MVVFPVSSLTNFVYMRNGLHLTKFLWRTINSNVDKVITYAKHLLIGEQRNIDTTSSFTSFYP
jgi:hypothetical protein